MLGVRMFGGMEVSWHGAPLTGVASGRAGALLAYLLLARGLAVSRDALAYALWPEKGAEAARGSLRRALHQLRHALPTPPDGAAWLITQGEKVQWPATAPCLLDVTAFEQLADDHATLSAAVAAYRGDLLPDFYDDWLITERERLRQLYLSALLRLAQSHHAARDYAQAVVAAKQLLAAEPLHEQAVRLLMSAHYAAGDRPSALQEYDRFATRIEDELATPPLAETLALYDAILDGLPLPGEAAARTEREAAPNPTLPLLGREDELAQLLVAWRRAAGGRGGLALISGEAGIGKTRLAAELSRHVVAEGGYALHGGATAESAAPYLPLTTALRPTLPLLARLRLPEASLRAVLPLLPELRARLALAPLPPLDPKAERERQYDALAECLAALAATHPTLLVLEDLHWADLDTLDLVLHLAPKLAAAPLLLLVTYREEEVGRDPRLRDLRQVARRGEGQTSLKRLAAEAGMALAQQVLGDAADPELAERLYTRSAGNPFFLTQLVWHWQTEGEAAAQAGSTLPQQVTQLIGARLARLQTNTRLLAEIAAVAGVSFNVAVMGEVAGWDEAQVGDAISEMLGARLIGEASGGGGDNYAFSHQLIQDSIYRQIEPTVLRRRHYRLARVLEEFYPARLDELAAELAHHYAAGGAREQAVSYYLRAAEHALSRYADAAALTAATHALELAAQPQQQFAALALQEQVYQRQAQQEQRRQALDQMETIAEELGDAERQAEVLQRKVELSTLVNDTPSHSVLLAAYQAYAETLNQPRWWAKVHLAHADFQLSAGNLPAAEQHLLLALASYETLDDLAGQAETYYLLARGAVLQRNAARAATMIAEVRRCAGDSNPLLLAKAVHAALNLAGMSGQYELAYQHAQEYWQISQLIRDRRSMAAAYNYIGNTALLVGRYREAQASFTHAEAIYTNLNDRVGAAAMAQSLGRLNLRLGFNAAALSYLRLAEQQYGAMGNFSQQFIVRLLIANIALYQADYSLVKRVASTALQDESSISSQADKATMLYFLSTAEIQLHELAVALTHLHEAVAVYREQPENVDIEVWANLVIANLQAGDVAAAGKWGEEGLTLYKSTGRLVYPQQMFWAMAVLSKARGADEQATEYLQQAYRHFNETLQQREQQLADIPENQWRANVYQSMYFNRGLLAAYEHDEWPAYTQPGYLPTDAAEPTPACPKCASADTVRAGRNSSGSQRFSCRTCQKYFTLAPKLMGYDDGVREVAMRLHDEGLSLGAIARQLGVNRQSVSNWLKQRIATLLA